MTGNAGGEWQRFMETTNAMIVRASTFGPMRADRFVFPLLRIFRWLLR